MSVRELVSLFSRAVPFFDSDLFGIEPAMGYLEDFPHLLWDGTRIEQDQRQYSIVYYVMILWISAADEMACLTRIKEIVDHYAHEQGLTLGEQDKLITKVFNHRTVYGVDPETPLRYAISKQNLDLVKFFLDVLPLTVIEREKLAKRSLASEIFREDAHGKNQATIDILKLVATKKFLSEKDYHGANTLFQIISYWRSNNIDDAYHDPFFVFALLNDPTALASAIQYSGNIFHAPLRATLEPFIRHVIEVWAVHTNAELQKSDPILYTADFSDSLIPGSDSETIIRELLDFQQQVLEAQEEVDLRRAEDALLDDGNLPHLLISKVLRPETVRRFRR